MTLADEQDDEEEDEEKQSLFEKIQAAFPLLMAWLYRHKDFTYESMTDEEVQSFVRKVSDYFDHAVDTSIRQVPMAEVSVQRLKESNYVFSGIKVFHELNEAFPSMLDDNNELRPFEDFLNDVQKVNNTYNGSYLKTEYNFARQSSLMAARWKSWEKDGDRYYLQYRTVGDKRVRYSHRLLEGITLPMSSKFWDLYLPPNNFGCRCSTVQVRKDKYQMSDEKKALDLGSQATAGKYQEMFKFNPGKEMTTFPAYNAYTIRKCKNCKYNGTMKLAADIPDNEQCGACLISKEQAKLISIKQSTGIAYKWISENIPEKGYKLKKVKSEKDETFDLEVSRGSLKDVVDHCKTIEQKLLINKLVEELPNRKHSHYSKLGKGKKGDPETVKKNLLKKERRGVVGYNYYTIEIDGINYLLDCEVYKRGFEKTYALKKWKKS